MGRRIYRDEIVKLIDQQGITDPYLNLALEEYAVRHLDVSESYLLLYVNEASVVVGKHQNVWEEMNLAFTEREGIPVLRRISGGGAVYHDPGNLNFSIITRFEPHKYNNYEYFTRPIIRALRKLNVPAALGKNNEIEVSGLKISGNAQFTSKDRMLSHGTILFSANLTRLRESLRVPEGLIESKSVKSRRSPVANLVDFLPPGVALEDVREAILREFWENPVAIPKVRFTDDQWREIEALAEKKYRSWEWCYGESPRFVLRKTVPWKGKPLQVELLVREGRIRTAIFRSEAGEAPEWDPVAERLEGLRYHRPDLRSLWRDSNLSTMLPGLAEEHWLEMLFP